MNVIVLADDAAEVLIPKIIEEQGLDAIIPLPEDFGVGDACFEGVWEYGERPAPAASGREKPAEAAEDPRLKEIFSALTDLESRMNALDRSFGELRTEVTSELARERKA
ncbi:MAG: hypothetical protein FWD39_03390 [Clostridiales bacterium]|nr:hypothetical protein [Clostridiales bacterium]